MSEQTQAGSKPKLFGIERDGKHRYIRTPVGRWPIGAWWVFALTLLLLPLLPFAVIFWFFGWLIAFRYRGQPYPPSDARAFKWIGRTLFQVFWLPQVIYFRFRAPIAYQQWHEGAARAGRAAARRVAEHAEHEVARVIIGDDGARTVDAEGNVRNAD